MGFMFVIHALYFILLKKIHDCIDWLYYISLFVVLKLQLAAKTLFTGNFAGGTSLFSFSQLKYENTGRK